MSADPIDPFIPVRQIPSPSGFEEEGQDVDEPVVSVRTPSPVLPNEMTGLFDPFLPVVQPPSPSGFEDPTMREDVLEEEDG